MSTTVRKKSSSPKHSKKAPVPAEALPQALLLKIQRLCVGADPRRTDPTTEKKALPPLNRGGAFFFGS